MSGNGPRQGASPLGRGGPSHPLTLGLGHHARVGFDGAGTFQGHAHAGYEWVVCLAGRMSVQSARRVRHLGPRDFLVLNGVDFHFYWPGEAATRYFTATFQGHSQLLDRTVANFTVDRMPHGWGASLFGEKPLVPEEILCELIRVLLALGRNHPSLGGGRRTSSKSTTPSLAIQLRTGIAELLEREPGVGHTLADLCGHFQMARSRLSEKVKDATGHSLMDLYHRVKVDMAMPLLREGLTISECAERLGYANPFHFSRKFKEIAGRPPSRVRPSARAEGTGRHPLKPLGWAVPRGE